MDKTKYIVHYRNLQLYISLGMKLEKIHRVIKFDQIPWMEPYIRLNTDLKKIATSDFEKNLYKLMNNSVFGKTMENLWKRVDVKLIRSNEEERLRKLRASPAFNRSKIFDNDLAALHMQKITLFDVISAQGALKIRNRGLLLEYYFGEKKTELKDTFRVFFESRNVYVRQIYFSRI